jgi:hypothetical protein
MLLITAVATCVAILAKPVRPSITADFSGDPQLADQLRALITKEQSVHGRYSIAAAIITPNDMTYAAIGKAGPDQVPIGSSTPFEAGSITKTFNGQLLADAIDRGEVTATDPLSMHLPELSGTPIGEVTLEEAVSHRGGIPSLPSSTRWRIPAYIFQNKNPYADITKEALLAEVRNLQLLPERGQVAYSNLGATLLGHALSHAAGYEDWSKFVNDRLFDPLKMNATVTAATASDIPANAALGYSDNGRVADYWPSPAYRPSGASTFTTIEDMASYAQAIMTETAPGVAANRPRWNAGNIGSEVGYAWFTTQHGDTTVTWHNGGTGGFSTLLALDLQAQQAVMVMGNTSEVVDEIGFALLTGETPTKTTPSYFGVTFLVITLLALGRLAWTISRRKSWLAVVTCTADTVTALALTRILGPWSFLTGGIWGLLVAITTALPIWALSRNLPAQPERGRKLSLFRTVTSAILALSLAALLR